VLATILVLAACGSSSNASNNSTSTSSNQTHIAAVDACSLVTAGEASSAAGATLTNLTASLPQSVPGICVFGEQASSGSATVIVYAQVYPDSATADQVTAAEFSAAMQGQIGSGATSAKEVKGIGDRAFEFTSTGGAGDGLVIIVFKYNVIFMIAVDPSSSPGTIESLAKKAIDRLH
jgi:hypothetical protein